MASMFVFTRTDIAHSSECGGHRAPRGSRCVSSVPAQPRSAANYHQAQCHGPCREHRIRQQQTELVMKSVSLLKVGPSRPATLYRGVAPANLIRILPPSKLPAKAYPDRSLPLSELSRKPLAPIKTKDGGSPNGLPPSRTDWLPQQGKDARWRLVRLSQDRGACLHQDLVSRELHRLLRHVDVLDARVGRCRVLARRLVVDHGIGQTVDHCTHVGPCGRDALDSAIQLEDRRLRFLLGQHAQRADAQSLRVGR